MQTWKLKYLHEDYDKTMNLTMEELEQPCSDVFWIPFVSEVFTKHLIEEMEHFGRWSDGKTEV